MTLEDKRYLQDKLCQERDKELLLKDLSARTPHGVKVYLNTDMYPNWTGDYVLTAINSKKNSVQCSVKYFSCWCSIEDVKPYLFPMSSMTEEQQEEFDRIYADDMQVVANNLKNRLDGQPYERNIGHYRHIDWLNKNNFDYRGLIPKGLAKDATGLNIY